MDHAPNSDTFQKHYLNRNVVADLWAVHRGHQPQQELLQQATSHGHSRNTRRPVALTQQQRKDVLKNDKRYQRLTKQIARCQPSSSEGKALRLKRESLRTTLRNEGLKKVREAWAQDQAVQDVVRQIDGQGFTDATQPARDTPPMGRAQQRMYGALTAPLPKGMKAINQRRTEAVKALAAYCHVEEPTMKYLIHENDKLKNKQKQKKQGNKQTHDEPSLEQERQKLRDAVYLNVMGKGNIRKCYICVAKAMSLQPDDPTYADLTRDFSFRNALIKHFNKTHLSRMLEEDSSECPLCELKLEDKMHLQNHSEKVHGLKTDGYAPAKYW